jgi:hypothetical protein
MINRINTHASEGCNCAAAEEIPLIIIASGQAIIEKSSYYDWGTD